MALSDKWNARIILLKKENSPWLTNKVIARAVDVGLDRVNSWTRTHGGRCDHAFVELLEFKINNGMINREFN